MNSLERNDISNQRNYLVVKGNDLIQKTRFELSLTEQKTIAYICSLIKPTADNGSYQLDYEFNIRDYCKICGLDYNSGKNYSVIKATLQKLSDRSFWLQKGDWETLCRWLVKVSTNKRSGVAKIKIDEDLVEYLFGLGQQFTQYELWNVLAMKSAFSVRLYELMKSYAFRKHITFDINELKRILMVDEIKSYERFPDFRRKVIEIAIREINELTDLNVVFEPVFKGKRVEKIKFLINLKSPMERYITGSNVDNIIDGKEL